MALLERNANVRQRDGRHIRRTRFPEELFHLPIDWVRSYDFPASD